MSAWSRRGRLVLLSRVCTRKGARGMAGPGWLSPQPRRALSCSRPARPQNPALNIWVSRGGPGRVRRAGRLGSLPTLLPGSRLPSPRLFWTAGSQPGVFRVSPCRGAISPAACPGCPAEDPFLLSGSSKASPVEDLDTRERVLPCRCFPRSSIFFFIMLKP